MAGTFAGSIELGPHDLTTRGGWDAFVARLDDAGEVVGALRFGAHAADWIVHAAADRRGAAIVAGRFEGAVDVSGTPLESPPGGAAFVAKIPR